MSSMPFFVLSVLSFVCCMPGLVISEDVKLTPNNNVTLFQSDGAQGVLNGKSFQFFQLPLLVGVEGGMVALAEAKSNKNANEKSVDVVATYIDLQKKDVPWSTTRENMKKFDTTVVSINLTAPKTAHSFVKLSASAKGTKVFMYIENFYSSDVRQNVNVPFNEVDHQLIVGEVKDSKNNGEKITWGSSRSLNSTFETVNGRTGAVGHQAAENALFFAATYKRTSQFVPTVMYLSEEGNKEELMHGNMSSECFDPSVLEWEKGKLLMITACGERRRRVYESEDKGQTWTEALATLSRVWGNAPKRTDHGAQDSFIIANISGRKVLLFAQPITRNKNLQQLRLWMTDGTHIYNAGLISEENRNYTMGSLLYNDGKLYSLFEVSEGGKQKIMLAELTKELNNIKYALRKWNALQENLSKHCNAYGVSSASYNGKCDKPIPTDGLVGFLSNQSTNAEYWKEEYLCVSAALKGGTKIPNGMRFRGAGAGARWPVGIQGQNQRYHFANYGFTLAATLAIHQTPTADAPLLGASMSGLNAQGLLGVSVSSDKKWKFTKKDGKSETLTSSGSWELHKTYHVALVVQNDTSVVYIDGQEGWNDAGLSLADAGLEGIENIYIGGDWNDQVARNVYVTVTDVFLYNRRLNSSEILALCERKVEIFQPADAIEPEEHTAKHSATSKTTEKKERPEKKASQVQQGGVSGEAKSEPKPMPNSKSMPEPTQVSTQVSTQMPTEVPTQVSTQVSTQMPTEVPTQVSTQVSTQMPTEVPTQVSTQVSRKLSTPEAVNVGNNEDDDLVNYGVSTYAQNRHIRKEIRIPKELAEVAKLGHNVDGDSFYYINDGARVNAGRHVNAVSVILLGTLCLLGIFFEG